MSSIDFYFDFSSPYGYFASTRIERIAERYGCEAHWRPYVMGAVMKITGAKPIPERPIIADYGIRDMYRCARRLGVPFKLPEPFPVPSVAPSRAFFWLQDQDRRHAVRFAHAAYAAYFAEGRNISEPEVTADVAAEAGAERAAALAALQDPAIKDRLRRETDAAIERGVFGSPFFLVDGEPFWGHDRLPDVERWLETGGW
jgi:2-hydroxychromene-2-carboxylate isomerase